MKAILLILFLQAFLFSQGQAKWSERMSETAMRTWPDSFLLGSDKFAKWRYDQGVILKGIEQVWKATGDGKWFNYIQQSMDFFLGPQGGIRGYRPDEYNIDHLNNGKLLLLLYQVTGREKYKLAADLLRSQLLTHPRTAGGGFWHKKIYPYQMWLDGLYMGQPFYAEYAGLFHEDSAFNDIARQFILMEKHARDPRTGLLYHAWDESREQKWANKATGQSPHFWGRSLGWYGMALVDVLDHMPAKHPKRQALINILKRFAVAVTRVQDPATGLWYDIPDLAGREKNYLEASASCMLTYTLAKGSRKGWLPPSFKATAKKAWQGITRQFIEEKANGDINLLGTVSVSGLGGNPYRDGSYEYYMSEPVVVNDPKGVGAFILCAAEMELSETQHTGRGISVLLDNFHNRETKTGPAGTPVRWHYTWDDRSNGGYYMLGELFNRYGVGTNSLHTRITSAALGNAGIFIIVDPDEKKENPNRVLIDKEEITALSSWVKNGGVLVLLGNDKDNMEFVNFNRLASVFGIRFNEDSRNRVENDRFEDGVVMTPAGHPVFGDAKKLYIKEYASLALQFPAKALVTKDSDTVMAIAKYGKGTVFALGDPWIYNEYLDGRKLPASFQNYAAAEQWIQWLIRSVHPPARSQRIIVSPDGQGDFRTIQGAINSLPDSSQVMRTIYIKKGIYREKIYIEKNRILLEGEDRDSTLITASIARDEWRCGHMDDWGVATLNVGANDISLKNLSITNSFGFDHSRDKIIYCAADTVSRQKELRKNGHQMALRTMNATRLKAVNCHFRAYGGDTVSPWEVESGLWYFRDCIMEGGVDFYCPRGWAWAENCEFISHNGTAAIWHDGSRNPDAKTVLKNCRFSGYDNFFLGRYHRDAQFFLVDCTFARNMRDSAIYRVPTNNTIQWGHRVYYSNCKREGGMDFTWYADNLPAGVRPADITPQWLFKNKWTPELN